jgi:hypothetical protein
VSDGSIWSELEVAPTATESDLKKAYARKLRITQPEDDPEGFVRLREAYEAALAYVRSGAANYDYYDDALDDEGSTDRDWENESHTSSYRPDILGQTPRPFEEAQEAPDLSADAQDMQRANAAFSAASQAFIDGLQEGQGETPLVLLFRDVMQASKHVDLETASAMPRWMAQCLLHFSPASDVILLFAINYFGWDDAIDHKDDADVIYAILARQRFAGELSALQSGEHALSAAWTALTTEKSNLARRMGAFFDPDLSIKVRTLFDRLEYDLYGLAEHIRADASQWWQAFIAKPRLSWIHIGFYYFIGICLWAALLVAYRNVPGTTIGLMFVVVLPLLILTSPFIVLWLEGKNPAWQLNGAQPWHQWLSHYWIAILLLLPPMAWLTSSSNTVQMLLVFPVLLALAAIIVTGDYQRPQSIKQWLQTKALGLIWPFWVFTVIEAGPQKLEAGHYSLAIASAFLCIMAKNTGGQLLCEQWDRQVPKYAASSFLFLAMAYLGTAIMLATNNTDYAGYRLVLAAHVVIVVINVLPYLSDAGWVKGVLGWGWIALVAIMLFASSMVNPTSPARTPDQPSIIPPAARSTLTTTDADLDLILEN